jgi:hypothetical protein
MPKVMATRSIANEPTSAWLPRIAQPPAIERSTGGCSTTSVCGGCGAITTTAATIARQLTASIV